MVNTAFKKAVIPSVEHFTELLDSYYNLNLIHNDCLTHCISNYEITKQMCFILLKYWFKQQQQQKKKLQKSFGNCEECKLGILRIYKLYHF